MNAKSDVQTTRSTADTIKLVIAIGILVAGSIAFTKYGDESLLIRVAAMLGVVVVAVAIVMQTVVGRRGWQFVRDARTEVRKVVWPTRQETVQTTLIVIVMVILVAIMLWIMDSLLSWVIKSILTPGS